MTEYPGRDCPDVAHELDDLRRQIDRLTGERDRQYEQNAAQIVRIAELEAALHDARITIARYVDEVMRLQAENERMRALIRASASPYATEDERLALREFLDSPQPAAAEGK